MKACPEIPKRIRDPLEKRENQPVVVEWFRVVIVFRDGLPVDEATARDVNRRSIRTLARGARQGRAQEPLRAKARALNQSTN